MTRGVFYCGRRISAQLNTLLSTKSTAKEKKEVLTRDFHINMESTLREELNLMCNLSDLVEEKGVANKIRDLVSKKIAKGQSAAQIAEALEEDIETIQRIISELTAP